MEHADRLDLPKGHVDPGENDMQCAMRELEEETGIAAEQIKIDPAFRFETHYMVQAKRFGPDPVEKTLVIFLGEISGENEIKITEHLGYRWCRWNPPHQIQAETIDPLLAELASHLNKA